MQVQYTPTPKALTLKIPTPKTGANPNAPADNAKNDNVFTFCFTCKSRTVCSWFVLGVKYSLKSFISLLIIFILSKKIT